MRRNVIGVPAFEFMWAVISRPDVYILAAMQIFLMITDIWQEDLDQIKVGIKSGPKEKEVEIVESALKKYYQKIFFPESRWSEWI